MATLGFSEEGSRRRPGDFRRAHHNRHLPTEPIVLHSELSELPVKDEADADSEREAIAKARSIWEGVGGVLDEFGDVTLARVLRWQGRYDQRRTLTTR